MAARVDSVGGGGGGGGALAFGVALDPWLCGACILASALAASFSPILASALAASFSPACAALCSIMDASEKDEGEGGEPCVVFVLS